MSDSLPKPLVTVVVPCYNYAHTVERTIQSIKDQSMNNFECFIVDDGSTDNSREVIEAAIKDDSRFHYIHQNNSGVAEARNAGVFAGTGKYVACLDADDAWHRDFLEACVLSLEDDPTIAIAYTGLYYYKPDGEEGLSPWPTQFDYDKFLQGMNQIPTSNVARREVWERLGGQRQRYCPHGAGEEDAELWLRAGAYGFNAKKVTDAGLFLYSWMSGRVSGSKTHRMTDWRAWHPWTKDGRHPCASCATPVKFSHPVRQYDQPFVSVIIPVGPGHERYVETALDSLEAQTFRGWEAIVVRDSDTGNDVFERTMRAYPYARRLDTGGGKGAGYARNRGADIARSPLLLYLDADDWFLPNALETMLNAWSVNGYAVYSDYIGKAMIAREDLVKFRDKLLDYDEWFGIATLRNKVLEYDCERAKTQPHTDMYIWALVSTLFPIEWHFEIGGFDETMKTWEDWDYWIRMARAGKCFERIPEPLVVYRFYSGGRRESAIADGARLAKEDLIPYLIEKYKGTDAMACNCSKRKKTATVPARAPVAERTPMSREEMMLPKSDDEMVLIEYNHRSLGQARVIGMATGMEYGHRARGDKFLVHREDIKLQPTLFVPVAVKREPEPEPEPEPASVGVVEAKRVDIPLPPPPPMPEPEPEPEPEIDESSADLEGVPWVSPIIAQELNSLGVYTRKQLAEMDFQTLVRIKNVGPSRARKMQKYASEHLR